MAVVEEQIVKPYHQTDRFSLYVGDCRSVLPTLEDNSVDSIVCDPPYGLEFMGKDWDAPWKYGITKFGFADNKFRKPAPQFQSSRNPMCRTCRKHKRGSKSHEKCVCESPDYDETEHRLSDMAKLQEWCYSWAIECLRVLKPGGHLLAFGGSRTYHRLASAVEDAGFEIRDQIQWLYGSGFPKSLDVSKQIDLMEKQEWENIKQLFDRLDHGVIIELWNRALPNVELVDTPSLKNRVGVGFNMQRSDSVPVDAPLSINPKRLPFSAIIAELQCCEAPPLSGVKTTSVRANVDINTGPSQVPAVFVEQLLQNPSLKRFITVSIAQCVVKAPLNEKAAHNLRDEEALKIWLGKKKCLEPRDIDALCAGLIDGLRLTILSQSKTFRNLDTQSQTECVSAMTVTTTASTAASLISFTVDTLKSIAIDAAAGAEREVVALDDDYARRNPNGKYGLPVSHDDNQQIRPSIKPITRPACDAAKQWSGWGTALKPAHEPIVLARKPLIGTVAQNILEHGTGGLNIDGCRIELEGIENHATPGSGHIGTDSKIFGFATERFNSKQVARAEEGLNPRYEPLGRWPANIILDGSEEVLAGFPDRAVNMPAGIGRPETSGYGGYGEREPFGYADSGSASRFFYCAKSSQEDRNEGLDDLPVQSAGAVTDRKDGSAGLNSPRAGAGRVNGSRNAHPTVKPTELMRYLCRLITPPGGLVLDPFCGSGSTGKAAMLEGLRFVGIELSAEYCELARLRIEAVTKQGLLFT